MTTPWLMAWLPLRLRLALVTAVLPGLTILAAGLALYQALEVGLVREVDRRLAAHAHQLGETIAQTTQIDGRPRVLGTLSSTSIAAPGILATLITPDGQSQILAPTGFSIPIRDHPALIAAGRAGRTTSATVQVSPDEHLRLLATPIPGRPQMIGVLVVGESLRGVQSILSRARGVLLLVGVVLAVLITGGVALVLGRRLAAISTLTRLTADIVASENYRTRVALPARHDDIYRLSATVNDLISTVQRTLDQQRQFLAFTSHELRSPLTVILANLDLLRRDLSPEERALSVRDAMEEASRMRRLVNDLLLLAEQDSTRVIERTPMRLDSLVEETAGVMSRHAESHNVRVEVAGPVVVEGDAERLTQIVRNLVENALIHTPAGTTVQVRLAQVDGCARITVADNGPGIAPEHLPYLWDRFYRVDTARSRVKDSTGLGLPIVEYIAEAHGGSVTVSSSAEQGTMFTVWLPLAPQYDRTAAAEAATV